MPGSKIATQNVSRFERRKMAAKATFVTNNKTAECFPTGILFVSKTNQIATYFITLVLLKNVQLSF